jgi:dihydroflavonol-4-reductase
MIGPYKRSKFLAERGAEDYAARGLPVVIVNPSNPIGAWEVRPTPTGQMVLDYLLRRMVATLDTGLNLIHIGDVARGHLLAAHRGRVGEEYVLGCQNLSLTEIFRMLERTTGIPAPRVRVPHAVIDLVALVMSEARPSTHTYRKPDACNEGGATTYPPSARISTPGASPTLLRTSPPGCAK